MKTINGSVISTKPISLSKAASVLHEFINEDTGASQAVSLYLKRASAAFDELVQFHKELRGRSHRKHKKKSHEEIGDGGALTDAEASRREQSTTTAEPGRLLDSVEEGQSLRSSGKPEGGVFDDVGINNRRKKKKDSRDSGHEAKLIESSPGAVPVVEAKREEKKKKKRKKDEVEDGGMNAFDEQYIRKSKKSKRSEDEK